MAMVLLLLLLGNVFFDLPRLNLLAIILLIITMTKPGLFKLLAVLWFGFSHALGTVMSKVLLTLVFVVVICPIGILVNLFRGDPMKLRHFKKATSSAFFSRDHQYTAKDLSTPY